MVRAEAWKSAAIVAGACLEALLFDLWFRHESIAIEVWKERWPRRVTLNELAAKAADHRLISRTHRGLADAMRLARNLVHPLETASEGEVSPQLVQVLLGALNLLNRELATDTD